MGLRELTAILYRRLVMGNRPGGLRGRFACSVMHRLLSLCSFSLRPARTMVLQICVPSTTSKTANANTLSPNAPFLATWVMTAPPRLCPIKTSSGSSFHPILAFVSATTLTRSLHRVSRLRSRISPSDSPFDIPFSGSGGCTVVSP